MSYGNAFHGDAALSEERVQKIVCHLREIGITEICAVSLCQFTSDIEFYV